MTLVQIKLETVLTTLYLVASPRGLVGVHWRAQQIEEHSGGEYQRARDIAGCAAEQMTEYVEGTRRTFELPLDVRGTAFQRRVWSSLTCIPYGQTRSYQALAVELGSDKGARAVGNANAKNPLCIVLPCHRIVASDGSLGGYSGGVQIKRQLLALEERALMLSGGAATVNAPRIKARYAG